jgi:hypothetical protein
MNMNNQKGFANIILVVVIVILLGAIGYFAFVKKSEPVAQQPTPIQNQQVNLPTPSAPTLTFTQGAKPFVQINFDYSIAKLFNIYRSISATNGWQKIISNFPSNAHTAVDYDYPKDAKVLYYKIVSVDERGQESVPSPAASVAVTTQSETVNWQSHSNTEIGFSFKYPQAWKVEDGLKTNTCCLNVFNSTNPYQGDFLKQNVMKAQFQYHVDVSISNKQQYIDSLIKGSSESEMETPISRSSVVSVQNENGLDIIKFTGGVGSVGYVIPRKQNFSEVIYVIVWNPDSTFGKVLSTLKLTK